MAATLAAASPRPQPARVAATRRAGREPTPSSSSSSSHSSGYNTFDIIRSPSNARDVRARFRVKGEPDAPSKEEIGWNAPPGIPPNAWSVRMHVLADVIGDDAGVVADVGCGHGLLAIGLSTGGRCVKAIAIDASAPEVEAASANARKARAFCGGDACALNVDVRLGNGAEALNVADATNVIVVAGVGAKTMINILEAAALGGDGPGASVERLVLNPPAKDAEAIRRWLMDSSRRNARGPSVWVIDDERLVVENEQLHVVVAARRATATPQEEVDAASASGSGSGSARPDLADVVIGPVLRASSPEESPLLGCYLGQRLEWTVDARDAVAAAARRARDAIDVPTRLVEIRAFVRWEEAGKPENTSEEWRAAEFVAAREDLELEIISGASLNDIRRRFDAETAGDGDDGDAKIRASADDVARWTREARRLNDAVNVIWAALGYHRTSSAVDAARRQIT